MRKITLFSATVLLWLSAIACSDREETTEERDIATGQSIKNPNLLIGTWLEPNPINEKEQQGIKLYEDGSAESVNMATLRYLRWWKKDDSLVLVAESIGNRTSSIDTSRYQIQKLDSHHLELKGNAVSIAYQRLRE